MDDTQEGPQHGAQPKACDEGGRGEQCEHEVGRPDDCGEYESVEGERRNFVHAPQDAPQEILGSPFQSVQGWALVALPPSAVGGGGSVEPFALECFRPFWRHCGVWVCGWGVCGGLQVPAVGEPGVVAPR